MLKNKTKIANNPFRLHAVGVNRPDPKFRTPKFRIPKFRQTFFFDIKKLKKLKNKTPGRRAEKPIKPFRQTNPP